LNLVIVVVVKLYQFMLKSDNLVFVGLAEKAWRTYITT